MLRTPRSTLNHLQRGSAEPQQKKHEKQHRSKSYVCVCITHLPEERALLGETPVDEEHRRLRGHHHARHLPLRAIETTDTTTSSRRHGRGQSASLQRQSRPERPPPRTDVPPHRRCLLRKTSKKQRQGGDGTQQAAGAARTATSLNCRSNPDAVLPGPPERSSQMPPSMAAPRTSPSKQMGPVLPEILASKHEKMLTLTRGASTPQTLVRHTQGSSTRRLSKRHGETKTLYRIVHTTRPGKQTNKKPVYRSYSHHCHAPSLPVDRPAVHLLDHSRRRQRLLLGAPDAHHAAASDPDRSATAVSPSRLRPGESKQQHRVRQCYFKVGCFAWGRGRWYLSPGEKHQHRALQTRDVRFTNDTHLALHPHMMGHLTTTATATKRGHNAHAHYTHTLLSSCCQAPQKRRKRAITKLKVCKYTCPHTYPRKLPPPPPPPPESRAAAAAAAAVTAPPDRLRWWW